MLNMSSTTKSPKKGPSLIQRISDWVESKLQHVFAVLGLVIARRPWHTIIIVLICVGLCGIGMVKYHTENRTEKLWVPTRSDTVKDQEFYELYFGSDIRIESFIVIPKDDSDVLTKSVLIDILKFIDNIKLMKAYPEGETSGTQYTMDDLCFRTSPLSPCMKTSILSAWDYNQTLVALDPDILATLNSKFTVGQMNTYLGKPKFDSSDKITSAKAVKVSIFLENNPVLIDGTNVDAKAMGWEKKLLDTWSDMLDSSLTCYPTVARGFSDIFGGAIRGDLAILSISYVLIVIYVTINIGKFHKLESGVLLSLGGVASVGLCILASFGLSSGFGFLYGPVHSVLSFLFLGIGVDNAFVLASAFRHEDHISDIPERLSSALAHAGVSITVTSTTNFVAFFLGFSTDLPALSSFCFYAAMGIILLYFIQCTFFSACLALDAQRIAQKRADCLPCYKVKVESSVDTVGSKATHTRNEGWVSKFLRDRFAPIIMGKYQSIAVVAVFVSLLGGGIYCTTQLDTDSSFDAFIPVDSYIYETNKINDEYFSESRSPVYIITKDIDYFGKQDELAKMRDNLDGVDYLMTTKGEYFTSWYEEYIKWLSLPFVGHLGDLDSNGRPKTSAQFISFLSEYLKSMGGRYASEVAFDDATTPTKIMAARFTATFDLLPTSKIQVQAMDEIRSVVKTKLGLGEDGDCFAFSFAFVFYELYKTIEADLQRNFTLAISAVFLITLILIAHPVTALLVSLMVGMTIVDILGVVYLWGLSIDAMVAVNMIMVVGLSVDYSAHIAHNFMIQEGDRKERVAQTLGSIGGAVLNGAASTFLAVCMLGLSKSYVFVVFFKMLFSTCVFGALHGLVLLPVILSYVGPAALKHDESVDLETADKGDVEMNSMHNPKEIKVVTPEENPKFIHPDAIPSETSSEKDGNSEEPEKKPVDVLTM